MQEVLQYAPMVRSIAMHIYSSRKIPPSVDVNDLIQAGMVGLMEAAGNYQEMAGASFKTFANRRVSGAIIDELRRADMLPRTVRQVATTIGKAIASLERELFRTPTDGEVATALGVSLKAYQAMARDACGRHIVHFEDLADAGEDAFLDRHAAHAHRSPLETLTESNDRERLSDAIDRLPARSRRVVDLYYGEDLTLREIGTLMGVHESRVCQMLKKAIAEIREQVRG